MIQITASVRPDRSSSPRGDDAGRRRAAAGAGPPPGPRALRTRALAGIAAGLVRLPPRLVRAMGDGLGVVAAWLVPWRHRIAVSNLGFVLPRLGRAARPPDVAAWTDRHFRHLGRSAVEALVLPALGDPRSRERWVRFEGLEHLDRARPDGPGPLILTAHMGNVEMIAALALLGYDLWALYRHRDYLTVRILTDLRASTGLKPASRERGLGAAVRALGRGAALVVVADQGLGETGTLFGAPVSLPRGATRLAAHAGTVLHAWAVRGGDGRITVTLEPATRPDDLLAGFTARLEQWIERAPEQYYWVHDVWRRFKQRDMERFALIRAFGGRLHVRDGYQDRIPVEGPSLLEAAAGRARTFLAGGRGPCPVVDLGGGEEGVLRHYRRGGLLGPLLGDVYVGHVPRPLEEIRVSERLRGLGIPTPEVLAAFVGPVAPLVYRADLLTRRIPDAIDLAGFLLTARPGLRRRMIQATGDLVRRLHEAGLDHPDLNLRNFLVQGGGAGAGAGAGETVWVIDLDRSTLRPGLSRRIREGHLRRIHRSWEKIERHRRRDGLPGLRRSRDLLWFLRGYRGGSLSGRAPDPEVQQIVRDLLVAGRPATPLAALPPPRGTA